jgi:phosphatidylglycerophosphate synthase
MVTVSQQSGGRASHASGARGAAADLVVGLALALGAAGATWRLLGLPASYLLVAAGIYGVAAALILRALPEGRPGAGSGGGAGLGAANRVTLGRTALSVPVLALAAHPGTLGPVGLWWVIGISTTVMLLDGVDGRIARRTGTQSAFGARFDMELDAALLLALSLLVWRGGRAGAWVLLIGLMRYGFVAAGRVWPALGAELPESLRRKAVCVVQGVALLVALGPVVPAWMAVASAAAGLAALTWSFAVDVHWALTHGAPDRAS